ncbi:MAG: cupin domain-containing protein [Methanolobus sp.]|uniref:cupin domain-containing protein n=1 Tax=Methanolobus sp. TaxID=1874737 RepID=UPI002731B176|nr:cupin domain-containing protein [Methanolobus sp.]MDP2216069.1 cupin domain-containing protein [Methanolobus sp.]
MSLKISYNQTEPYITKDGSSIRELMHPLVHGNRTQSLAEAIVMPGCETLHHMHAFSEEIYHITAGSGYMTVGEDGFQVNEGDSICILPGEYHSIRNTEKVPLKILCCCSPPYSHEDTELKPAR